MTANKHKLQKFSWIVLSLGQRWSIILGHLPYGRAWIEKYESDKQINGKQIFGTVEFLLQG